MNPKYYLTLLVISLSLCACGQNRKQTEDSKTKKNRSQSTINNSNKMDLSKITNEKVKQAIEALQSGDKSWYSFFTPNPVMTDDGNNVDFKIFFAKALGEEKFLSIDKVENEGKDVYGNFKAGQ